MKKYILPLCILAIVACSKDEDEKTTETTVEFNKANLTGAWNVTKIEGYTLPGDSLFQTMPFTAGQAVATFNSDNSYSITSPFGNATGTFSIIKISGKDALITKETGEDPDTAEIVTFSKTAMVFSDREQELRDGDDDWTKTYLSK